MLVERRRTPRSAGWYVVDSPTAPGVAAQQTPRREDESLDRTVLLDRRHRVGRARGVVLAGRRAQWRDPPLVQTDGKREAPRDGTAAHVVTPARSEGAGMRQRQPTGDRRRAGRTERRTTPGVHARPPPPPSDLGQGPQMLRGGVASRGCVSRRSRRPWIRQSRPWQSRSPDPGRRGPPRSTVLLARHAARSFRTRRTVGDDAAQAAPGCRSGRELGATLATTGRQDGAAGTGAHTKTEAVSLRAAAVVRLEGPLGHGVLHGSGVHGHRTRTVNHVGGPGSHATFAESRCEETTCSAGTPREPWTA